MRASRAKNPRSSRNSRNNRNQAAPQEQQPITTTRALIGLLLADGELDIARLNEMLGPKRAREVLKEALASGLIEREAQLEGPRARARRKRLVRLLARGEQLEAWKERARVRIQESLPDPDKRAHRTR